MANRYEIRIPKVIKVTVRGTDRHGNAFKQTASTINISRYGARLEGVPSMADAQVIEVSAGWFRHARFRVVWAGDPGTPEASQVGIRCLEPTTSIWGVEFPPPQPVAWNGASRREKTGNQAASDSGPIPVKWDSYSSDTPPSISETDVPVMHATDEIHQTERRPARHLEGEHRVPITVRWTRGGRTVEENLVTARVMKDGSCMLSLKNSALEGTEVEVINSYSSEMRKGRISWCGPRTSEGACPAAIELLSPDPQFWAAKPKFEN